ncbi:MAG: hypothetical protein GF350_04320, partial [Chitinivibrionales bacterium]|nr:hypothetical protein [Chitinivibrionales bacterium]
MKVIESTSRKLVLSWEMEDFSQKTSRRNGKAVTELSFSGANTDIGSAGEPVLPAYSFLAGVPRKGNIQIQFSSGSVKNVSLPYPVVTRPDRGNPEMYAAPTFTQQWMSQPKYQFMRKHRIAKLVIRPFIYEPGSRRVRVLLKGSCIITFPSSPVFGGVSPGRSEFLQMMKRNIINYEISSRWIPPARRSPGKKAAVSFPLADGPILHFTVGDGADGFNEGTIDRNGIMKITGQEIISTLGSSVSINQLCLYASEQGEMNDTTPGLSELPSRLVNVPLVRVDAVPNGVVDEQDYILAYVTEASDWVYFPDSNAFSYRLNRYTDDRHYWLKQGTEPWSVGTFSAPAQQGEVRTSFPNRILFKKPLRLPTIEEHGILIEWEGGIDRIWKRLTPGLLSLNENLQMPF